jgi:general secretion pathway protein C
MGFKKIQLIPGNSAGPSTGKLSGKLVSKPLPSVVLLLGYLLAFSALAACLAYWAMQLLAPQAPVASSGVVAEKSATLDLSGAGNLFGSTTKTSTAAAPTPAISIQIQGLIATRPMAKASAILTVDGRPPQAFALGDSLGNGTRLLEITPAGIVIEKDGQKNTIALPARQTVASLSQAGAAASNKSANPNELTGANQSALPKSSIAKIGGPTSSSSGLPPPTPTAPIAAPVMQPPLVTGQTMNNGQPPQEGQNTGAPPGTGGPLGGSGIGRPK